jgi:hypothetical protein
MTEPCGIDVLRMFVYGVPAGLPQEERTMIVPALKAEQFRRWSQGLPKNPARQIERSGLPFAMIRLWGASPRIAASPGF